MIAGLLFLWGAAGAFAATVEGRRGNTVDGERKWSWKVEPGGAEIRDFHICLDDPPPSDPPGNDDAIANRIERDLAIEAVPPGWQSSVTVSGEPRRACIHFFRLNAGAQPIPPGGFTFQARFKVGRGSIFSRKSAESVTYYLTGDGTEDHGAAPISDPIIQTKGPRSEDDNVLGAPAFASAVGQNFRLSVAAAVAVLVLLAALMGMGRVRGTAPRGGGPASESPRGDGSTG